jgi:hypothetical protein
MRIVILLILTVAVLAGIALLAQSSTTGWKILGVNDLGMHCMDGDFSVFSILPPYNNIHAQVVDSSGKLVKSASGLTVTYEAVADPAGSINRTSAGKTNFWNYVLPLFGVKLPVDAGLAGFKMPGVSNKPQTMAFDVSKAMWHAEGIPITPVDDAGRTNAYPLLKLVVKGKEGKVLASARVVAPVSSEMDCGACHGSGTVVMPPGGWTYDPNRERDYKWNILKTHDARESGNPEYTSALAQAGYKAAGLTATAQAGTPVLCAKCHGSNALPGTGIAGVKPLTEALHGSHAGANDPQTGMPLGDSNNRSSCYRCHPGSETRCLRGTMGNMVAADGTMAIQCQNCHGGMSDVGRAGRTGWLEQPNCQACHTGTATMNSGQIRYTSVFSAPGVMRIAASNRFATNPDTPAAGFSLYRLSKGHGGLQCEVCHGSTHAEFPSSHANDNLMSLDRQGHVGTISECTACHKEVPETANGGPHGMHPVGSQWVSKHKDHAKSNPAQCQECHGLDYRGTELSRAFGARTLTTELGTLNLWRGFQIGCYNCHRGPRSDDRNPNRAPVAANASITSAGGSPAPVTLAAVDADGNALAYRIITQPSNGTVALSGNLATYRPFAGYQGTETFTWAAWDGSTQSNLATVTVKVQ